MSRGEYNNRTYTLWKIVGCYLSHVRHVCTPVMIRNVIALGMGLADNQPQNSSHYFLMMYLVFLTKKSGMYMK